MEDNKIQTQVKDEKTYKTFIGDETEELLPPAFNDKDVFWINPRPETTKEKTIAYLKLALLALPWLGVQCIWGTEFGTITEYFKALGVSDSVSVLIWIAGPLTGFFVAPFIGSMSDHSNSKYGRRRPFMVGGLVLLGIASTFLALAKHFGHSGVNIAITMFVFMDAIINIIQTPLRALIADFAPPEKQATGQLLAVAFQGMGGVLGFGLQKLLMPSNDQVLLLYLVVFAINVLFVGLTCLLVKEEYFPPVPGSSRSVISPFVELFSSIRKLSFKLFVVGMTVFFSWWAVFTWLPMSSTWYRTVVMDGCREINATLGCDADGLAKYEEGKSINETCNMIAYFVQTFISICFAVMMNNGMLTRTRFVWSFVLCIGCVLMVLTKFLPMVWYSYLVGAGMAIPMAGINSFPFAIVGKYNVDNGEMDVGAQFGLLNLFIVVPQICCTFFTATLESYYGKIGLTWAIFSAGCAFGIAAFFALFIKENQRIYRQI